MTAARQVGAARRIGGRDYAVMVRHDRGRLPWVAWVAVIDDGDSLMVGSGYTARTRLQAIALAQRELDERAADEQVEAARQADAEAPPMNGAETERTARAATDAALAAVPEARKAEWRANWDRQRAAAADDADSRWQAYLAGLDGGDTPDGAGPAPVRVETTRPDAPTSEPAVLTADETAALEAFEARWAQQPHGCDYAAGTAILEAADRAVELWGAKDREDACYRFDLRPLIAETAEEQKMRRSDALYEIQYGRTPAEGAAARRGRR